MIIEPKTTKILIVRTAVPPIDVTFLILSIPFVTKNVIHTKKIAAIKPRSFVPDKKLDPKNDQLAVLSLPKIMLDTGTQIPDETFTIHNTYDVYHINVPINAYLGPTDLHIHEYIPPFSSRKAEPYSATINANGIKNKIPAITNQGIAAYPIR